MTLPSSETYDVAVLGGGSAGLAAAVSAAREGARTVLLERRGRLGGMGVDAQVHTFCGLFHPDVGRGPKWLNEGLPREIGEMLLERSGQSGPDMEGRVFVLRHQPTAFARLAMELCEREPQLDLRLESKTGAVRREGELWTFDLGRGDGRWSVKCRALIDTTGDAEVAQSLGGAFVQTAPQGRLYRPGFIAKWTGVASGLTDRDRLTISGEIVRGVREGALPAAAMGATFRNSPEGGAVFVSLDLEAGAGDWNPLDADCVEAVKDEGRAIMTVLYQWLRESMTIFAQMTGPEFPERLGIRESIRWRGDHVLTAAELTACARFEDEVALAGWPLEKRETARGPRSEYFSRSEPAGIPARCLKNSELPGIFFAGRCLSCDHEALASLRVMGTCLATGQAAGRMAAAYAEHGD